MAYCSTLTKFFSHNSSQCSFAWTQTHESPGKLGWSLFCVGWEKLQFFSLIFRISMQSHAHVVCVPRRLFPPLDSFFSLSCWANNILYNMTWGKTSRFSSLHNRIFVFYTRGNIFEHKSLYTVKVSSFLIACVTKCFCLFLKSKKILKNTIK